MVRPPEAMSSADDQPHDQHLPHQNGFHPREVPENGNLRQNGHHHQVDGVDIVDGEFLPITSYSFTSVSRLISCILLERETIT